jgi:dipeptidyl aminopeptidase/acylaminoacyl peptidase
MNTKKFVLRNIAVKGVDGNSVYGCLQIPDGDGPFPAVIFIHGGLGDNREYTRAMLDWSVSKLLLREGFVVLSTDYRVSLTGEDIADVVEAFKYAGKLSFVNKSKIAYFGDSHGAFLAIMAAIRTTPFALVHGWGVADMAEWFRHIENIPARYYQKVTEDLKESLGGTPNQVPEAYRMISPTAHVAKLKCPVLILHGEEDEDVPVSHARILAEALEKANVDYTLKIFKNAGHGLRTEEDRREMDPIVVEFLKKILS